MGTRRVRTTVLLAVILVGAVASFGASATAAGGEFGSTHGWLSTADAPDSGPAETAEAASIGDAISIDAENLTVEFEGGYEERFIVEGYRSGRLGTVPDVRIDETLRIPIRLTNTGDSTESYELTLSQDGTDIDAKTGELDAGEETILEFEFEPDETGISKLELADWSTYVRVYDRDAMVLTDIEVSESRVDPGEEVTVTATLEGGASSATETVKIMNYTEKIHEETVPLAAGESTTVETTCTVGGIGGSFWVNGTFVTGSEATVEVNNEWEGNDSDFDFNDSEPENKSWENESWTNDSWENETWENDSFGNDSWENETWGNGSWENESRENESWENFSNGEFNESERESGSTGAASESDGTDSDVPGFGPVVAIAALLLTAAWSRRHR